MKLFGTPGSPYVRKVRIALVEKRMAYRVHHRPAVESGFKSAFVQSARQDSSARS